MIRIPSLYTVYRTATHVGCNHVHASLRSACSCGHRTDGPYTVFRIELRPLTPTERETLASMK